jgi:hypothetical protein
MQKVCRTYMDFYTFVKQSNTCINPMFCIHTYRPASLQHSPLGLGSVKQAALHPDMYRCKRVPY